MILLGLFKTKASLAFRGTRQQKKKEIIHRHVSPNLYDFLFSVTDKRRLEKVFYMEVKQDRYYWDPERTKTHSSFHTMATHGDY